MSISIISTHAVDAINRMLEQYKRSPRLKSFIEGLANEIQNIENSLGDLDSSRSVQTATGANLDRIGATVGVYRNEDLSDDIFRILIIGKISANISQGETESVITTYLLLTQATQVTLSELFPATISVFSNGSIDPDVMIYVKQYLKQTVPAGVGLDAFGIYDDDAFGFAGDPGALGFGDDNDPTVGGKLASQFG